MKDISCNVSDLVSDYFFRVSKVYVQETSEEMKVEEEQLSPIDLETKTEFENI